MTSTIDNGSQQVWQDHSAIMAAVTAMATELRQLCVTRAAPPPLMVGIHTGGVVVAERLAPLLALADPLGCLDISFYRDDFTRIGLHPQVRPSLLPVPIDDRAIILVDDVIHTGRTLRAALNVLFDYGRPAQVFLATLVERDGRELPIEPNVVGLRARLEADEQIKLVGTTTLTLMKVTAPAGAMNPPRGAG